MFRKDYPIAWTFHRNTCLSPDSLVAPHSGEAPAPFKEYLAAQVVPLGGALAARLSCRRYLGEPPALDTLSTLLHAGYGVLGAVDLDGYELLTRPVPSAGATYPLELYVVASSVTGLEPGIYHYAPLDHTLERLPGGVPSAQCLAELFLGQDYAGEAPLLVVATAVLGRLLAGYADRGYRLLLLEAGHVGQNLSLAAAALGLGALSLGGFFDQELAATLELDLEQEVPLYAAALGLPAGHDPADLRRP